jgi:hypothetical protein
VVASSRIDATTQLAYNRLQQLKESVITMLPPVEDAVLRNNPQFAALYSTLTTTILNPDGSTKNDPAAKERSAIREVRCQPLTKHPDN